MYTKVFACLALVTIANGKDVIVGLKTDGKKFFDENRQANPALWRQMDNVTIKAPENEVIRRVVITDLRPEKDGDVKVVEGGEGQKNVTIELKSPTVLRGYEFHIEVYSTPEENVPYTNENPSTTEIPKDDSTTTILNNLSTNLGTTSNMPDLSGDKIAPALLSKDDQLKENERQGRQVKNEGIVASSGTMEFTYTTLKSDISTSAIPQHGESTTESRSEISSEINTFEQNYSVPPKPLAKKIDTNYSAPTVSVKDKLNMSDNDGIRQVRDTETEMLGKNTETKLNVKPMNLRFELSTENIKEVTTTEISDAIPVEEKSEDDLTTPKYQNFYNRKYTSIISSKVEQPGAAINIENTEKSRHIRGSNQEHKILESVSALTDESTTTNINEETSTPSSDECITTESTNVQNPINIGKDNKEVAGPTSLYLNNPTAHQYQQSNIPNRR